jgi:hypothetical protein
MTNAQKTLSSNSEFLYLNLGLAESKTYLLSLGLIAGSILFPSMLHQFNLAGEIFLPIYFFVLIGAYKFGWKVGVITGLFSPLVSFALTGMPMLAVLPSVIIKGIILALVASFFARKNTKLSILNIILIVFSYELAGSLLVYLLSRNFALATADVVLGYPGLLLEIIGGYVLLKFISGYGKKELETN